MEINVTIANRRLTVAGDPTVICGNSDYYINLVFDAEWSGYDIKTLRVVWLDTFSGRQRHIDTEFTGSHVNLPTINDAYEIQIGVYVGDQIATAPATIECERSITDGATYHGEPTQDVYEQLLAFLAGEGTGAAPVGVPKLLARGPESSRAITGHAHDGEEQ